MNCLRRRSSAVVLFIALLSFSGYAFSQGSWTSKAPIPTPASGAASGVIDGKLYVAGGCCATFNFPFTRFNNLQVYDPKTDTWTARAPMPLPVFDAAAGVINGKLYVAGGAADPLNGNNVATLQIYDPANDTWTTGAPLPAAGNGAFAGVINSKFYVAGGQDPSNIFQVSTVVVYDPATNVWSQLAPMPTARSGGGSTVINGILYTVGGAVAVNFTGVELKTVEAYNPVTNTWTSLAPMPTARGALNAEVINNILYAAGGIDNINTTFRTVEAYNPISNTWSAAPSLLTATSGAASGVINDTLYIAGGGTISNQLLNAVQAFTPAPLRAELVDPVPSLVDGTTGAVLVEDSQPDTDKLATLGRQVQGIVADGATQLLIRVSAANAGDLIKITLRNDQGGISGSFTDDGGLEVLGGTAFDGNNVSDLSVQTSAGPMAFALYRAPADFPRTLPPAVGTTCGGVTGQDSQLPCRSISLHIEDTTAGSSTDTAVFILRPPVVLIHGIWSNPNDTWGKFGIPNGTLLSKDPRFTVASARYDFPAMGLILSSSPSYLNFNGAQTNSFGFAFTAPRVLSQIQGAIAVFRDGANRLGVPVAGVQADIVAHSMGGVIARSMVVRPHYLSDVTFRQGVIHKMITIDTPHLGTPVALQLLQSGNGCVRKALAKEGNYSFQSVVTTLGTFDGAVLDLQGDGTGTLQLSDALVALRNSNPHPLPTALLAGVVNSSNLAGLDVSPTAIFLHDVCGEVARDSLGLFLTSSEWPTVFSQPSDALVPLSSQVDGLSISPFRFGVVHSPGTELLGFAGPSVLDPLPVPSFPSRVIDLLNTPVSDSVFNLLTP